MAFCTSLEGQTVSSLGAYATSSFGQHSLISTVFVVQNVVNGNYHRLPHCAPGFLTDFWQL